MLLTACPRAGGSCERDGEIKCVEDQAALMCVDQSWRELDCAACDSSGCLGRKKAGQPCTNLDEPLCTSDTELLECKDGRWEVEACTSECKNLEAIGAMCF